jgi:hypothetical protein
MRRIGRLLISALAASTATLCSIGSGIAAQPQPGKRIEVAFVLDTTGSMADLIDGAKRKIWSIANSIVDINPNADIHMALIGYRDQDDEYVIKSYDMSRDIEGLYGNLIQFVADGGGDTPESVNEALDTAINKLTWSADDDTRRIVFLVGDAPPHMDYDNGPKYSKVMRKARDMGIIVNTVQAGIDPETYEYWQDIAELGGGRYFAIPQDGGQVEVISSPYDDAIIELQQRINQTVVPYGTYEKQSEVRTKMETKAAAAPSVQVDNSKFYSKRMAAKEVVTGGGDLLDDVRNNVRSIDEIEAKELPADMQKLSKDEIRAEVAKRTQAREKLEADMAELVKQRDAFVAKETEKKVSEGSAKADSFDSKVTEALSAQF